MNLTVQIHSDNLIGINRTIILTKTAGNKARIDIEPPIALGLARSVDFKNVKADPPSIAIVCQLASLFSCDVSVVVQATTGGQQPVATINVSKAFQGNGTYACPLAAGDDARIRNFLQQAGFPQLSGDT